MTVPTLVLSPPELAAESVSVSGDAYRHLFRSRRLAVGDAVRLVDGGGGAVGARVARVDGGEARLEIGGPVAANEPDLDLTIWSALPRPRRASWLVEKVTEIGVGAVRWIDCERAGRRPTASALERQERVAMAAVEQCGRARVPDISGPHDLNEVVALAGAEPCLVLDPGPVGDGDPPRDESLTEGPTAGRCHLLIGPEGGFTDHERRVLASSGVGRVGLGRRILRVETAAVAGAAMLLLTRVDGP